MIVIGLTGSIGMGKSTTANIFRSFGVPVHDADATVHQLYAPGGQATQPIFDAFPGVHSDDGSIDRTALRDRVLNDADAMKKLESIVHPMVRDAEANFLQTHRTNGAKLAVLDIPLLFETGANKRVDKVVVVTAPFEVQRARVMARPGMTEEAFQAILAKQTPDSIKRDQADFLVDSSQGLESARLQVLDIIKVLTGETPDIVEDDQT